MNGIVKMKMVYHKIHKTFYIEQNEGELDYMILKELKLENMELMMK